MNKFKTIIITRPDFFNGEAEAIARLFADGLEILHLRKPNATEDAMRQLLDAIPANFHSRIVVHDHHSLASSYSLRGIHLNSRNPLAPAGFKGHISCSCHTLDEVVERKAQCDYVFLSPIFDSISKTGYGASFSAAQLADATGKGIIDEKVIALGGISRDRLPEVEAMGFGGAALLGDIWSRKIVLTIAGSDSSGGAGIQADIKAISALGGYAASAITAITAQNTQIVAAVYPMTADAVEEQIAAVMDDLRVDAVKIGMVFNADIVSAIARNLKKYRPRHIVFDPVMISTSGKKLMEDATIRVIKDELIPLAELITPNLHEARLLFGDEIETVEQMEEAAMALGEKYHTSVLLKGGHLSGNAMCDVLYHAGKISRYTLPRIESRNLHGTGCTLSSAIATLLAQGCSMEDAVSRGKAYVNRAITAGKEMKVGHDNGPVWHFHEFYP